MSNIEGPDQLTEVEEENPLEDGIEDEFESVEDIQDLEIQLERNLAGLFFENASNLAHI